LKKKEGKKERRKADRQKERKKERMIEIKKAVFSLLHLYRTRPRLGGFH
jgi:hypothetical protein